MGNTASALVQLALQNLGGTQSELALKLGVSGAQITKWKKGEHISEEMKAKLSEIANVGDLNPEFVLTAGSVENAMQWERIMRSRAENAAEANDTGYEDVDFFFSHEDSVGPITFRLLQEMGIKIPSEIPAVIVPDEEGLLSYEGGEHPLSRLLSDIYEAYGSLNGFMASAGMHELIDKTGSDDGLIEGNLLWLAATKVEPDPSLLADEFTYRNFCKETTEQYRKLLTDLKADAFQQGLPLKAELMDLIEEDAEELSSAADSESMFGVSQDRLHPDIYMNELLVGMREVRQVLPLILKKLQEDPPREVKA